MTAKPGQFMPRWQCEMMASARGFLILGICALAVVLLPVIITALILNVLVQDAVGRAGELDAPLAMNHWQFAAV